MSINIDPWNRISSIECEGLIYYNQMHNLRDKEYRQTEIVVFPDNWTVVREFKAVPPVLGTFDHNRRQTFLGADFLHCRVARNAF